MVMENWSSLKESASSQGQPSAVSPLAAAAPSPASSASSQQPSSADDSSTFIMSPPTTDISRIIDQLQSGSRTLIEHALCSLMPLLERTANLDDPTQAQLRSLLTQRVNQLLETLIDTFSSLHQAATYCRVGSVPVMGQIHLLRATSHVLEEVIGRPDLAAGVSSKTIAAYVHAMLPVRRLVPGLEELAAAFAGQDSAGKIRRLTDLMARHGSLVLKKPSSLVGNQLDRSHLLVALLRETTAMLATGCLQPHFGFLVLAIDQLNDGLQAYLRSLRSAGEGQPKEEEEVAPDGDGEDHDDLGEDAGKRDFDRLNLDLVLYEVNRVCVELLPREFEGRYETLVRRLIENIETLCNSLIAYPLATATRRECTAIFEHFLLVPRPLEVCIPFRYIAGRLLTGGLYSLPEGLPQRLPPVTRILECFFDVEEAARRGVDLVANGGDGDVDVEGEGADEAMDLQEEEDQDNLLGGGAAAVDPEDIDYENEDGGAVAPPFGEDEEDDGDGGFEDEPIVDGLLPEHRLPAGVYQPLRRRRRAPLPEEEHLRAEGGPHEQVEEAEVVVNRAAPGMMVAPPVLGQQNRHQQEEDEEEEDAECVASRELLLRLVLSGHLGGRFGWATTARMALGQQLPAAILAPAINDYGQPRAAVMAAAAAAQRQLQQQQQNLLMQ